MIAYVLGLSLLAATPGKIVVGPDTVAEGNAPTMTDVEHWSWFHFPELQALDGMTRFRQGQIEVPLAQPPIDATAIHFEHPVLRRAAFIGGAQPKLMLSLRVGAEQRERIAAHVVVESVADGLRIGMPRSARGPFEPPVELPVAAVVEPETSSGVEARPTASAPAEAEPAQNLLPELPAPNATALPELHDGSSGYGPWLGWIPVALLVLAAWAWKRSRRPELPRERVRLVSACPVGHRGQLLIAEVEGRRYFLAAGDRGVNLLDVWAAEERDEPRFELPSEARAGAFDHAHEDTGSNQTVSGLLELRRMANGRREAHGGRQA